MPVTLRRLALAALICGFSPAAQAIETVAPASALVHPGNVVVTGFSGTRLADPSTTNATADADGIALETNGATLRVFDIAASRPGGDPLANAREVAAYSARALGQVFGVALDDAIDPATHSPAPNIYVAASSAYGLNIVLPPATPAGWPRRTVGGDPAARWMAGQWGEGAENDGRPVAGGPGSIWRIDGVTGRVTLFATIATGGHANAAAGLGNITYDPISHQFFVSDLETGLIHRLSLAGEDLGTFDHGVTARKAAKLAEIPDDATDRADIHASRFRTDDPETWGYAQPGRRVWGLNVSAGRLYYAVADGPEIWSVAINGDGTFGDSRRDIIVPGTAAPFEISDISFDSRGWIYLAQRPPVTGAADYLFLAAQAPARVLRYRPNPETHAWESVPEEYPVGLTQQHRQTDGGVALGYGYTPEGRLEPGTCDGTLWTTGDDLDRTPRKTAALGASDGPDTAIGVNISGIQWGPTDPKAATTGALRFAEFDGLEPVAATRGHVGGIRVFRLCGSASAAATAVVVEEPATIVADSQIDLEVEKTAIGECRIGRLCRIEVKIRNRGTSRYSGPLLVADALDKTGARLVDSGPSRWTCGAGGRDVSCRHPGVDLEPGFATTLFLDYRLPERWPYPLFADCAELVWGDDLTAPHLVVALEIELARLGLYKGEADRIIGPKLREAITAYQRTHELEASGEITPALLERIIGTGINQPKDRVKPYPQSCARFTVEVPPATSSFEPPPPLIEVLRPPILLTTFVNPACPPGTWNRGGTCVTRRFCPPGFGQRGASCTLAIRPGIGPLRPRGPDVTRPGPGQHVDRGPGQRGPQFDRPRPQRPAVQRPVINRDRLPRPGFQREEMRRQDMRRNDFRGNAIRPNDFRRNDVRGGPQQPRFRNEPRNAPRDARSGCRRMPDGRCGR